MSCAVSVGACNSQFRSFWGMQGEMEELEALAKELLPEGHPMQSTLQRSLRMLQVMPPPVAPYTPAFYAILVPFHPFFQNVHAKPAICDVGYAPSCDAMGEW